MLLPVAFHGEKKKKKQTDEKKKKHSERNASVYKCNQSSNRMNKSIIPCFLFSSFSLTFQTTFFFSFLFFLTTTTHSQSM